MSSPPTTAVRAARPRAAADVAGRALARAGAAASLAAALGACLWMVAAAAERPSVLSPPSLRTHDPRRGCSGRCTERCRT